MAKGKTAKTAKKTKAKEGLRQAVIVSACRTAVGRAKRGILAQTRPDDLGGIVVREAVKRAAIDENLVEDVILGCAMPEASQGMNVARIINFCAGLPMEVPAATINRFCASGLEAIHIVAAKIMTGTIDIGVAGGVESMTMVPMGGFNPSPNPRLMEEWSETYCPMGITAENVAKNFNVTKEEQDTYACESQRKAVEAIKSGAFKEQIVPVKAVIENIGADDKVNKKEVVFDTDECPRAGTTLEGLAGLKPAFALKGTVTAGNSSPMNDGAAALVLMSEEKAKELGCTILAYYRYYVSVGVPPEIMGVGPLYAIRKLFEKTGLTKDDIDLFEINEAFASQAYYCVKELGLDLAKVNVNGGAIALGHPLGCTGAKLTTQLVYEMQEHKARYGVVAMCIGGGMGSAGLFERVE
ncbi:MAG: thiolase family protein [bacterium]